MIFVILILALVVFVAICALSCLLFAGYFAVNYFGVWLEARATGLDYGWTDIVRMHFEKLNPRMLLETLKTLNMAGINVTVSDLEAHILSGGMLNRVRDAGVAAFKAGVPVDFFTIAAIDLAGRNVVDAINSHVNPKVLSCPDPKLYPEGLSAIAKDGIRLCVKARITVRTRLDKLVGNASEQTILARVGEGIVACIGRAEKHRELMENPQCISKFILERGLDTNTCFEIVSVDIYSIDIKDNASAILKSYQAITDKRIAQAKAEERRSTAIASQQEMKAKTQGSEVKVREAQKNLPLGLASAFHQAKLGGRKPLKMFGPYRIFWQ